MLKYIGKKVLIAIATVFVLATATFFLMKLIPGDPFLNDKIPVAVQDKQRAFYGLDKPVPQQYLTYMNNLLHGDLGYSIVVESMFLIPGLGRYFVDSVTNLDYPLIMGLTVFYGAFLVTMNLIVDVLYGLIDPRIRVK